MAALLGIAQMSTTKRKPDDPEQSKRFIETAEQVEADDDEALDRAFKKIAPKRRSEDDRR